MQKQLLGRQNLFGASAGQVMPIQKLFLGKQNLFSTDN